VPPTLDELKPRILQSLAQVKATQYIDSLKTVAEVK
jgi:hypothetical protein